MDAFTQGTKAFEQGKACSNNPYSEWTRQHDYWEDGWMDAALRSIDKDISCLTEG